MLCFVLGKQGDVKLEGAEWINLAQDRDGFKYLANVGASFQFPLNDGSELTRSRIDRCRHKSFGNGGYHIDHFQ